MYPCNTTRKKEPPIVTQLLQLFNVRLSYMIWPHMAIIRYYIFMLFGTNFHKATHFSNTNNNSLITETTCDSHQNSCYKCVTPPQLQPLFARRMVTFPVSNTVYSTQNVKEEIKKVKQSIFNNSLGKRIRMAFQSSTVAFAYRYQKYKLARTPSRCHLIRVVRNRNRKGNYVFVCVCVCVRIYIYIYTFIHTYAHIHTYMYARLFIYTRCEMCLKRTTSLLTACRICSN